MADKLGMSVTGYAKIERGEVRSNLPRLEQISEVFDMDICELLSYGETEKVYFNNSVTESTNSNNSNNFAESKRPLLFKDLIFSSYAEI